MNNNNSQENDRALRIALRINEYHRYLANIYEGIVDRDFNYSEDATKALMMELRCLIKSMKDDDF